MNFEPRVRTGRTSSRRLPPCVTILSLALATQCVPASATGFFIDQQSVRGLGRVNAGIVADASDPSTVFWNPAGLADLWRPGPAADTRYWVAGGIQLIIPRADIDNAGSVAATPGTSGQAVTSSGGNFSNPSNPTPVPNLYLAARLPDDNGYLGFGINSPFGLATKFSSDWFGRYDAVEASLLTVNLTAVAAYRLSPEISIGGGIDVQYARSKLVTAIPDPLTPGGPTAATDGQISTTGSAWTPGFNIGVLIDASRDTRFGLEYRSEMNHEISGTATTSGLTGPLAAANGSVGAKAKLSLPQIVSVGFAHQVGDLGLYGQAEWYGWSTFKEIRLQFDDGRPDAVRPTNYRDTWAFALGADYEISNSWLLRSGVRFDRTPTVNGYRETTFPDANRLWLGVGATYRFSTQSTLDLALNHVFFRTGEIDVTRAFFEGTPIASTVHVLGTANSRVNTISANFNYAF